MKIGIVAGEASGDLLGAKLIEALKTRLPQANFEGIGGTAMQAAGCQSLFDMERLAVMGLIEPLKRLPDLFRLRRDLYRHFTTNKPDIFIGIDAPDFNLGLECQLRQAGIPVIHYVSPSVWAWRQRRVFKIAKAVDMMLTLLPFEAAFYEKHQVPVRYVGHPLANQIPLEPDTQAARKRLALPDTGNEHYVALLPGSRRQEIHYLAEPMLEAAKLTWQHQPNLRFITSQINEERYEAFYAAYQRIAPEIPLQFFLRQSQTVMEASDVVLVTSGTATLEAMLYKKPMAIVYRMSRITYWLAKWLVKTPLFGLPNLLAGEKLVPELVQDEVKPAVMAQYILDHVDPASERVQVLKQRFKALHESLRVDSEAVIAGLLVDITKTAGSVVKSS